MPSSAAAIPLQGEIMAGKLRWSLLVVHLALLLPPFSASAKGAETADAPGVLLWLRRASEREIELDETECPALRKLARQGVSFSAVAFTRPAEALEALAGLQEELGEACAIIEAPAAALAPGEARGMARLIAELGAPPPPSEEEASSLARLRKASGAEPAARKPRGRVAAETHPAEIGRHALRLLETGKRLVAVVEPAGGEDVERDASVAAALEAASAGRCTLLLLLLPERGSPALIACGPGLKQARVLRQRLGAGDLAAGIAALLGSASAGESVPRWIEAALLEASGAKGGKQ
jgi:hypothetical protein